jgi:hypothetical protein
MPGHGFREGSRICERCEFHGVNAETGVCHPMCRCDVGEMFDGNGCVTAIEFSKERMYFGPGGPGVADRHQCWRRNGAEYACCVRG